MYEKFKEILGTIIFFLIIALVLFGIYYAYTHGSGSSECVPNYIGGCDY